MKHIKRLLLVAFSALCAVCAMVAIAACGEDPETKYYSLTLHAGENGTVSATPDANADGKYEEGTSITVTVKPNDGYEVDTFTVSGKSDAALSENGTYTFSIGADTTVNATFREVGEDPETKYHSLTLHAGENGTVSATPDANADGKYEEGTSITVTVEPNDGYEVDTFTVSGKSDAALSESGTYTFSIEADTTVNATFKEVVGEDVKTYYILNLSVSGNGTVAVSPEAGEDGYEDGTSITVTVTPNEGYQVKSFSVLGDLNAELSDEGTYTFAIHANTTITAVFEKEPAREADLPAGYLRTWRQFHTTVRGLEYPIEIDENGVTLKGNPVTVYHDVDGYFVKEGAFSYYLTLLGDSVLTLRIGNNYVLYSESGTAPVAVLPAQYRNLMWDAETFGRLTVDAKGNVVIGVAKDSFAIFAIENDADGQPSVAHALYNSLYYTLTLGETLILRQPGGVSYTFTPVRSEPLPVEYSGEWEELGGDGKVSVDQAGAFQYNGVAYNTIIDEREYGYHFTLDGEVATVMVTHDGYIFYLNDGMKSHYFKKAGSELTAQPFTAQTYFGISWTSESGESLTISEEGVIQMGDSEVLVLTFEPDGADYIATVLIDNVWYDVRFSVTDTGMEIVFGNLDQEEIVFHPVGAAEGSGISL